MRFLNRKSFVNKAVAALMAATAVGISSCDSLVYDNLRPCPQGLRVRFVYDYNMEWANAFPSQVDCLTLLVYNEQGQYVKSYVTSDPALLSNEDWRLELDLAPGTYTLETWGGISCENSSFVFQGATSTPALLQDVEVAIDPAVLTHPVGERLHPLFFGQETVTVPADALSLTDATVHMMKDTNNLRIVLQSIDGSPTNHSDFIFEIVDDNSLLNHNNQPVPQQPITYSAWAQGETSPGTTATGQPVISAFAELSTSRFVVENQKTARLRVTRSSNGATVIDIPLINCLAELKSQYYDFLGLQEFLDRESRWNMVFFLTEGTWVNTFITINDWMVRINNAEFD